jgi:hypothetical protein
MRRTTGMASRADEILEHSRRVAQRTLAAAPKAEFHRAATGARSLGLETRRRRPRAGIPAAAIFRETHGKLREDAVASAFRGGCECGKCFLNTDNPDGIPLAVFRWYRVHHLRMSRKARYQWAFYYYCRMFDRAATRKQDALQRGERFRNTGATAGLQPGTAQRARYEEQKLRVVYSLENPFDSSRDGSPASEFPVCLKGLQLMLCGLSGRQLLEIRERVEAGDRESWGELADAYAERRSPVAQTIIQFGLWAIDAIADHDPTRADEHIMPAANATEIYQWYCHQIRDQKFGEDLGVSEPASRRYFDQVFKRRFGDTIKPNKNQNKFSKCSYCAECSIQARLYPVDSKPAKEIRRHKMLHIRWQALCREKYYKHRLNAKAYPDR